MATGYNYAILPASSNSTIFFGEPGMNLRYALNQSLSAQTNAVALYDAPSLALYNANPSQYNLLFRFTLSTGLTNMLGNLAIRLNYGCIVVPAGAQNSDGGILIAYDGIA